MERNHTKPQIRNLSLEKHAAKSHIAYWIFAWRQRRLFDGGANGERRQRVKAVSYQHFYLHTIQYFPWYPVMGLGTDPQSGNHMRDTVEKKRWLEYIIEEKRVLFKPYLLNWYWNQWELWSFLQQKVFRRFLLFSYDSHSLRVVLPLTTWPSLLLLSLKLCQKAGKKSWEMWKKMVFHCEAQFRKISKVMAAVLSGDTGAKHIVSRCC